MESENIPEWILNLDREDLEFIKNFIVNSGSLKNIAKIYNVSYPTVRLRLDKLISSIENTSSTLEEPYVGLVKKLALNDKFDFDTAKLLIDEYNKNKGDN